MLSTNIDSLVVNSEQRNEKEYGNCYSIGTYIGAGRAL